MTDNKLYYQSEFTRLCVQTVPHGIWSSRTIWATDILVYGVMNNPAAQLQSKTVLWFMYSGFLNNFMSSWSINKSNSLKGLGKIIISFNNAWHLAIWQNIQMTAVLAKKQPESQKIDSSRWSYYECMREGYLYHFCFSVEQRRSCSSVSPSLFMLYEHKVKNIRLIPCITTWKYFPISNCKPGWKCLK